MIRTVFLSLVLSIGLMSCDTLSNLPGGAGVVTEAEAAQGIREALDQGVGRGIQTLNVTDGFFGSQT